MDIDARAMWSLFERVHSVTYFAPQARAAYEAAGLRGYWRGYFAGRAAPLGPVGPGPVAAMFFGFRPSMVQRAIPDVWQRLAPPGVLRARLDGAREALAEAVSPTVAADVVAEAAALLRAAADGADLAGRPLAAANADLPWPDHPLEVLWQAATVLREQRGDGHVAALVTEGLEGVESLAWRVAVDSDRQLLQPNRGWSDDEWEAAVDRLVDRGWLDADGSPTTAALSARDRIERTTDDLAAGPWRRLGTDQTARLARLLRPIAAAAAKHLPQPNPVGLPPL